MAYSNFTRKQAGVIYRAIKEGKVTLSDAGIKMMYGQADAHINHDVVLDDVESYLRHAVDSLFNGNIEEAQKNVDDAMDVYNGHFVMDC